jgi:endonuclease YncB( thermonuclease family)
MTLADRKEASSAFGQDAAEELVRHGITRIPVDYFHYGDFRYTNLEDALAQAKRQRPNESSPAVSLGGTDEMARYGITRVPVDHFYWNF